VNSGGSFIITGKLHVRHVDGGVGHQCGILFGVKGLRGGEGMQGVGDLGYAAAFRRLRGRELFTSRSSSCSFDMDGLVGCACCGVGAPQQCDECYDGCCDAMGHCLRENVKRKWIVTAKLANLCRWRNSAHANRRIILRACGRPSIIRNSKPQQPKALDLLAAVAARTI